MPVELRALVAISDPSFRSRIAALLVERGLPADAVGGATAAAALFAVADYSHLIIEALPADAALPRLLGEVAFRPDAPALVILAPEEPADFRKRLLAFAPAQLLPIAYDDATAAAVLRGCEIDGDHAVQSADARAEAEVGEIDTGRKQTALVAAESKMFATTSAAKAVIAVRLGSEEKSAEVAKILESEGYATRISHTTDELYAMLSHDRIDLLIIEERLPGFLSGLDVIEMLQKELLRPDVMLVSHVQRSQAERIKALMPSRIISPTSCENAIADAARSLLQQRKTHVAFIPKSARNVVAEHPDLKPLPQLLVKLTGYLSLEDGAIPVRSLAQDLQSDPRATADLLRFTNSSAHGLRRRVGSVAEAVTLLGPRRTIVLILSQCAAATSTDLVAGWQEPMKQWFYRRSVLTAGVAQSFASIEGVSPETAFLLGLVQDIGIAVTANAEGERYARLIERVQRVPHLTLPDMERTEFGHTHADVSAALLQKWEMPASLIDPVLAHHGDHSRLPKVGMSFVRLMQIGEAVADLADCRCPQRNNRLNDLLSDCDERQKSHCPQALADGVARAVEATELLRFPVPNPDSIGQLARELQAIEEGALVAIV